MPQIPTISNPSFISDIGDSFAIVGASSIYGGPSSEDYISELVFRLTKNNDAPLSYSYSMNVENSAIVSQAFNVDVDGSDSFVWEMEASSNYGAKTVVNGAKLHHLSVVSDMRLFIAHIGAYLSVIFTDSFQDIIRTDDIGSGGDAVNTDSISGTQYVIPLEDRLGEGDVIKVEDLKTSGKVIFVEDLQQSLTVITLTDYLETNGVILSDAIEAGNNVILVDDMLTSKNVIIGEDYIQLVGIQTEEADTMEAHYV